MISLDAFPILLSNGRGATWVDESDRDLSSRPWRASGKPGCRYAMTSSKGVYLHRVIAGRCGFGDCETVDHVDGDGLNNCRANLRPATKAQNSYNHPARKRNKSGFKGVSWQAGCGKWQASIKANGISRNLGTFVDPAEAHRAYVEAAKVLHGEFWRGK